MTETKKEQQEMDALLTILQLTLKHKNYGEIELFLSFEGR